MKLLWKRLVRINLPSYSKDSKLIIYEPFLSQKDELTLLSGFGLKSPQMVKVKTLKKVLKEEFKDNGELIKKLDVALGKDTEAFDNFIKIVEKGLSD